MFKFIYTLLFHGIFFVSNRCWFHWWKFLEKNFGNPPSEVGKPCWVDEVWESESLIDSGMVLDLMRFLCTFSFLNLYKIYNYGSGVDVAFGWDIGPAQR